MFKKFRRFAKEYRAVVLVALAMIVALVLDLTGLDTWSHWLLGGTAIIAVIPLVKDMWLDFRSGTYGLDILAITAILTSVILKEYWAGIVIVLMLTGGEALEDYAERRAKKELTNLIENAPKHAHVLSGRKEVDVPVSKVHVGDRLIIKPGEVVPVDCVIIEGASSFDESSLTGESLPVDKAVGDQLLSGSVNQSGAITVKALHTAKDSQYEQIIKLVRSAAASKAPFVRLADRYSIPFTLVAFIIAGGVWFMSGDPMRFLQVIVVATPCPLLLGAPIALVSGMSRAAKHGIIVKTGSALERTAALETLGFDKTGTLTRGRPVVRDIKTYGKWTQEQVLAIAAAVEQRSNHILARSIVEEAAVHTLKMPKTKTVHETPGRGLTATVSGQVVHIGRLDFLQDHDIEIPNKIESDYTTTLVAIDGKLAGAIMFEDPLREETKATLQALNKLGITNTLMVTGDNTSVANKIAKQIGITTVKAECLPADKITTIEQVTDRPVGFVGDGVNDAPVLTSADLGIALGARGSTAASESADVVIMQDNLMRVADAVAIAKRTFFIAKQSILIGIFISIGLMFIFATGKFKPVYGAVIQEFVDVAVIVNALRAHGGGGKKLPSQLSKHR